MTDRRILVTGGAGFIGSHLVETLIQENDVMVLNDLSSGNPEHVPPAANFVEGDIRDSNTVESVMRDIDIVFHQAGLVSVERSIETQTICSKLQWCHQYVSRAGHHWRARHCSR